MIKLDCFLCGTKGSVRVTRYSVTSWHSECSSCGRIIRMEEITENIEEIENITKILASEKEIGDIEDYGPETDGG